MNTCAIPATIGWICCSYGCHLNLFCEEDTVFLSFGGVAGYRARVLYRSTWMRYQCGLGVLNGVNLINNNLCLNSWICRWIISEGANRILSIWHVEAFVARQSVLVVGNGFARGVCDLTDSLSIGLYRRFFESWRMDGEWGLYNWMFNHFWSGDTMGAFY